MSMIKKIAALSFLLLAGSIQTVECQSVQNAEKFVTFVTVDKEGMQTSAQVAVNGAELFSAVKDGKIELVALLIAAGADINYQNEEDGFTPLHQTMFKASLVVVKHYLMLIKCADCVNKCCAKNIEMAQMLMQAGADVKLENKLGHTAEQIIDVLFAKIDLSQSIDAQTDIYLDVQNVASDADAFALKILPKFQALKELFIVA